MKKVMVLHVGTDKTGSTALQAMAAGNPGALFGLGVTYLKAGRGSYINHTRVYEQALAGDYSVWGRLTEELMSSQCGKGLVSFEGFYHFDDLQLQRIREAVSGVLVRVVIYLRRQSDMVRSGVAQLMKQGTLQVPVSQLSGDQLADIGMSYEPVLARFAAAFGRENLRVRRFERGRWREQDLFVDFFDAMEIPIEGGELRERFQLPERNPNPTLDVDAIHLLDTLDALGIERDRRVAVVRLLLSGPWRQDRSTFVSDELAERVDARFDASNRAIAEEWFGERSLFTEPSSFVCRLPDRARIARYFNFVLRWLPLLEMPVWGGDHGAPSFLLASGVLRLGQGWTTRPRVLRLGRGSASLTFRIGPPKESDIVLQVQGRWSGPPGMLSLSANDEQLYEGEGPSPAIQIPGWLHERRGGVIELRCGIEATPDCPSPVFDLCALSFNGKARITRPEGAVAKMRTNRRPRGALRVRL